MRAVGIEGAVRPSVRPSDLRHSFISILLAEGATVVAVARQAGHSPTMMLSTYAHPFEEIEGAERRSAEDEIRRARETSRARVRVVFSPLVAIGSPQQVGVRGRRRGAERVARGGASMVAARTVRRDGGASRSRRSLLRIVRGPHPGWLRRSSTMRASISGAIW